MALNKDTVEQLTSATQAVLRAVYQTSDSVHVSVIVDYARKVAALALPEALHEAAVQAIVVELLARYNYTGPRN